ncbi:MAG TPA: alpha/beta hydrolase [Bacillota bacterium]|nr:alpha/beta hydrolase [Bacillota bacterium]
MHDGNTINVVIQGNGHTILMPVNTFPIEGEQADEMKKWGVDSSLGKSLMDGLSDRYRVVAFDYEAHVLSYAKPETLIPENIARDFLAIADATDTDKFAYYGYSWLALSGMQLAIRTNRLLALVMGGFPPIDGPYREMLTVTQTTHKMSSSANMFDSTTLENANEFDWSKVEVAMSKSQVKQFVTLYRALEHFNDRKVQDKITCPRLCFAGSDDIIDYGSRWGEVVVNIAEALKNNRQELEAIG